MIGSKRVTPEEARKVWKSIRKPSARRVARALTQSGRPVHFSTVARWRAENWETVPDRLHSVETAIDDLDVCVPLLTGDPTTDTAALVEASEAVKTLKALRDEHLLSKAARQSLLTLIVLLEETRRQGALLIATNPAELGMLIKGLSAFLTAANEAGCQVLERQQRERQAEAEAEADRKRQERLAAELAAWKTERK
jgi:ATP-dependent helicase YprA (DUF1998 family)